MSRPHQEPRASGSPSIMSRAQPTSGGALICRDDLLTFRHLDRCGAIGVLPEDEVEANNASTIKMSPKITSPAGTWDHPRRTGIATNDSIAPIMMIFCLGCFSAPVQHSLGAQASWGSIAARYSVIASEHATNTALKSHLAQ
jgi:hypothetical protein